MLLIEWALTPICDDNLWALQVHKMAFTSQLFSNSYSYFSQIFWTTWECNLHSPRLYSSLKTRSAPKIIEAIQDKWQQMPYPYSETAPNFKHSGRMTEPGKETKVPTSAPSSAPSIAVSLFSATKRFRLNLRPESIRWLRTISQCCAVSCSEWAITNHVSRSFKTPWGQYCIHCCLWKWSVKAQLKGLWTDMPCPQKQIPEIFGSFSQSEYEYIRLSDLSSQTGPPNWIVV